MQNYMSLTLKYLHLAFLYFGIPVASEPEGYFHYYWVIVTNFYLKYLNLIKKI